MTYTALNFDNLLGTEGFSEKLLTTHFKLYQGYVANTNKCAELLMQLFKDGKAKTPEFAEVKRRFGWEFNGMRLHELYFGNMSKDTKQLEDSSAFAAKVKETFGEVETLKNAIVSVGSLRGIGWTVLYYDPVGDKLFVNWINEHDAGHLSGCAPLLVMDVFEHAFVTDYNMDRASYIKAFMNAVDWGVVAKRFDQAKR